MGSDANDFDVLGLGQGTGLAGGASNYQPVRPLLDMPVNQMLKAGEIERPIVFHGRNQRDEAA